MKDEYIIKLIAEMVQSGHNPKDTATRILERLKEEGVITTSYGNADVDVIIITFKNLFGTTKATRLDRFAASRLSKKYGSDAVVGIIKVLATRVNEPYCPVVGSITQLENKWVNVMSFLRSRANDNVMLDV